MADKIFDRLPAGINVASGFTLQAQTPLDSRCVVDTAADLDALVNENGAYEGMTVYVKEKGSLYVCRGDYWEYVVQGDIQINRYAGFQEIADALDEVCDYAAELEAKIEELTARIAALETNAVTI